MLTDRYQCKDFSFRLIQGDAASAVIKPTAHSPSSSPRDFAPRRTSRNKRRAISSGVAPTCPLSSPQLDSTVTTPELTVYNPVYLFPSLDTVTGYSFRFSLGLPGRCVPSVALLPNLSRQFKNLLEGFIGRLPSLQSVRNIQATDFRDRSIAVVL